MDDVDDTSDADPINVTHVFWPFVRACARESVDESDDGDVLSEVMRSEEYDEMTTYVHDGRALALDPVLPVLLPAAVPSLPWGCTWDRDRLVYVFDDSNALFYGIESLVSEEDVDARRVIRLCVSRIATWLDASDVAETFPQKLFP